MHFAVCRYYLTRVAVLTALSLTLQLAHAAEGKAEVIGVVARPVADLLFYPIHRAAASVMSLNESRVSAEITAAVREIPVKVGQVVEKGGILARLDCTNYDLVLQRQQAAAQSIVAKLDFAQYQLQRAQTLKTKQAVAEELLKQRETDLAVLQAEQANQQVAIQQAKRDVDHCLVRAPFNAIILERIGQVGELAAPGSHLLRILDATQREVSAKLQQYQISSLQGATDIVFEDRSNKYPLSIRAVTATIDSRERTQEVRLLFANDDSNSALPGTAGEISWRSTQPHLPADLLVRRNDQLGVFVVRNKVAEFYPINDAAEGRPVACDLRGDELVVTKGLYRLQPGSSVSLN